MPRWRCRVDSRSTRSDTASCVSSLDEVVRYAADVIVLEPVELRNEVRRGLERVASTRSDRAGAA